MKEKNNIDKAVKEKLEGFSVTPPPQVWANVQGQLAARHKARAAVIRWVAAAAVVVLAMVAGWHFTSTKPVDQLAEVQQTAQPKKATADILSSEERNRKQTPATEISKNSKSNIPEKDTRQNQQQNIVATTSPIHSTADSNDGQSLTSATKERVLFAEIKSREIRFQLPISDFSLAEHTIQNEDFKLTETDKMLMAANAASAELEKPKDERWKMGLNIAPGYSSQVVTHSASYAQNMSYTGESGNTNIGGGLAIQYKTGKRLSVESGVYYAQNGQKSGNSFSLFASNKAMDNVAPAEMYAVGSQRISAPTFSNAVSINNGTITMNGNAGVVALNATPKGAEITANAEMKSFAVPNTMVTDGEFKQVFDFVEIPLLLRFRVLDAKFGIEFVGGVNTGIVVGNNAYIENNYGRQNIGSTEDISTINLSGAVGVGLNYALGKHISVALEPRMNYYFNSINSNSEVDFRPYRVGVYTGVYYAF